MTDIRVAVLSPYDWEEPNFGGQSRIFQIVKNLGKLGFQVDVFSGENRTNSTLDNVKVHEWHELLRIQTYYPVTFHDQRRLFRMTIRIAESLRRFATSDVIISEMLNTAWHGMILSKLCRVPSILDEHNIEWHLRYQMGQKSRHRWQSVQAYEEICWRKFDLISVASENDRAILEKSNSRNIALVPNGVDTSEFTFDHKLRMRVRERYQLGNQNVVLFNGSFGYFPNVDAVNIIVEKILPETRRVVPNSCFMILGREAHLLKLSENKPGLVVPGLVGNIAAHINAADICVAPLRYGSGTRLKILEWMACGKPVIATKKAAEGIEVTDGNNIIIEDDIAKYPTWISKLCSESTLAESLGRNARMLMVKKYDWKECVNPLARAIRRLNRQE